MVDNSKHQLNVGGLHYEQWRPRHYSNTRAHAYVTALTPSSFDTESKMGGPHRRMDWKEFRLNPKANPQPAGMGNTGGELIDAG